MKYLVTGGAGFIGSHLVRRLLKFGHSVTVLDDLSTGTQKNLESSKNDSRLTLINESILNRELVDSLVGQSDRVFHLAAAVGVFNIVNDPLRSFRTNVEGTHSVLDACYAHKKPILFTSSSEIYGKNSNDALSETDDRIIGSPQVSRWSYSDSKAIDEFLITEYNRNYGLETRIVRLFNTVGPGQVGNYGMVIPRFVKQALQNESISIYGDGNQTRCFTHVDDVIDALILISESEKAIGQVFNIGNNFEISMLDLAKLVIRLTGSHSKIDFIDYQEAYAANFEDMRRRVPNTSKLRSELGWIATKSIEEIILDVINYEKSMKI